MSNSFDDENYNLFGSAGSAAGKSIVKKILKSKAGKVAIAFLVIFFVSFIAIWVVFGFALKLYYELGSWFADDEYHADAATSSLAEKKYYLYYNDNGDKMVVYENSDGVIETVTYKYFISDAYCFNLLMESGEVDIKDSDTGQLDDSDVEKIFDYIIEEEEARKETITKAYEWPDKLYDYVDVEVEVTVNEYADDGVTVIGSHQETQIVKSANPEWQPDDEWEKNYSNRSHWNILNDSVQLSKKDVNGEKEIDGLDRFMVRWQMITGICTWLSYQNGIYWGDTGDDFDFQTVDDDVHYDTDGYYLSDETIREIIDAFTYNFTFYNKDWSKTDYSFEDIEKTAYRCEYVEMDEVTTPGQHAFIKKTPEVAPKVIRNFYETYIYEYAPTEDEYGTYICTGRTKYTNAVAFVRFIEERCPNFHFDDPQDYFDFCEVLRHFPESEWIVNRIEEIKIMYDWQMETGEEWYIEEYMSPCFSSEYPAVRLGKEMSEDLVFSPEYSDDENSVYAPLGFILTSDLGDFCVPTSYTHVTSEYGWRTHPIRKTRHLHGGIDLAAASGTTVWSAFDGVVVGSYYSSDAKGYDKNGYGNYIIVEHTATDGTKFKTLYGHLSSVSVSSGTHVSAGTPIGAIGSTGSSTGPHLHFEFQKDGQKINPRTLYDF
jgi:hypothetical protein